ncbi:MAG: phage tail protein [Campylobacteraceae bacterium]|jgi:phage protein U|nr:phage tail protein [Campylobacteraceae bacterium]
MLYSLGNGSGNFKFKSAVILGSIQRVTNYNITKQSRLNNHSTFFSNTKEQETITINGFTLPNSGAKNNSLDKLYNLAAQKIPYLLVAGNGKRLGKFIISNIDETRSVFLDNGTFLAQEFTIELIRSWDD